MITASFCLNWCLPGTKRQFVAVVMLLMSIDEVHGILLAYNSNISMTLWKTPMEDE